MSSLVFSVQASRNLADCSWAISSFTFSETPGRASRPSFPSSSRPWFSAYPLQPTLLSSRFVSPTPYLSSLNSSELTFASFRLAIQSLIVPLAYLIHTQFDATLSLLESTPIDIENSQPVLALEVLLKSWAENAETFQGSWAIRVSTLALADLFASERPSLAVVGVRGEMIQDAATAGSEFASPLVVCAQGEGRRDTPMLTSSFPSSLQSS